MIEKSKEKTAKKAPDKAQVKISQPKVMSQEKTPAKKKSFKIPVKKLILFLAIIIIGFLLMSGAGSNEHTFDTDIFSTRRIVVAPTVTLIGFLSIIYAVIHKPKDNE